MTIEGKMLLMIAMAMATVIAKDDVIKADRDIVSLSIKFKASQFIEIRADVAEFCMASFRCRVPYCWRYYSMLSSAQEKVGKGG